MAVVIPVYNEHATVRELVERLRQTPSPLLPNGERCVRTIVLVDDGSTDGSGEIVRSMESDAATIAIVHRVNQGKGASLRTGFKAALDHGAELILVQDADLEYDPADHAAVVAPILAGRADAVIGSRFIGQTHRVLYYWHSIANRVITTMSNMLTNLNLTDIECCLKAFRREVVEGIEIQEKRFGVEPELVAKLSKMRLRNGAAPRVYEVAVSYAGRTYAEGKKITWRDGVSALRCIVRYNLLHQNGSPEKVSAAESGFKDGAG